MTNLNLFGYLGRLLSHTETELVFEVVTGFAPNPNGGQLIESAAGQTLRAVLKNTTADRVVTQQGIDPREMPIMGWLSDPAALRFPDAIRNAIEPQASATYDGVTGILRVTRIVRSPAGAENVTGEKFYGLFTPN